MEPRIVFISDVLGSSRNSWKCSISVNESVDIIEDFGDQDVRDDNDEEFLEVRPEAWDRKGSPTGYNPWVRTVVS